MSNCTAMRRTKLGAVTLLTWLLLSVACGATGTDRAQAAVQQPDEEKIVLCLTKSGLKHYVHPREAMEIYHSLVYEYMIPQLGFPIEFRFFDDDKQMYTEFAANRADVGCSHIVNFLKYYERGLVKPLVFFQQQHREGQDESDHYILVVRQDSGITSLKQLQHKVLGINHPYDRNKIRYLFFNRTPGFDEKQYFSRIQYFDSSRDTLYSLYYKSADVIFETEYALNIFQALRPQLSEDLRVLAEDTQRIADLPIFYRSAVNTEKMNKIGRISDFFLHMHEDAGLHDMLNFLGCDQVKRVTVKEEQSYYAWIKKYRAMGLIPTYHGKAKVR